MFTRVHLKANYVQQPPYWGPFVQAAKFSLKQRPINTWVTWFVAKTKQMAVTVLVCSRDQATGVCNFQSVTETSQQVCVG